MDTEQLLAMLIKDMKHWSIPALKEAALFVDGMVLSQNGENFLWWWELHKAINRERARKEGWHCGEVNLLTQSMEEILAGARAKIR